MTDIACIKPWTSLEVQENYQVKACCWTQFSLGVIRATSLPELWNGKRMQEMRANMIAGQLEGMCPGWCPRLADREYGLAQLRRSSQSAQHRENLAALCRSIEYSETVIAARPIYLKIFPTARCNIDCRMCNQDHTCVDDIPFAAYGLDIFLPTLSTLSSVGGEPLLSRPYRDFVAKFNPVQYPDCRLKVVTNGLLINDVFAQLIPGRFREVGVSIDGATQKTYEFIRQGASWVRLQDNLQRIAFHPRRDYTLVFLFTITAFNWRELCAMLPLAEKFTASLVVQPAILPPGHEAQLGCVYEVDNVLESLSRLETEHRSSVWNIEGTRRFYRQFRQIIGSHPYEKVE